MGSEILPWLGLILAAYLCGSIPFAYLIGRAQGIDIRQHGSGNVGASNVGRILGRRYGALCFVLDVLKGFVPTLIAGMALGAIIIRPQEHPTDEPMTSPLVALLWLSVAIASILGHMFPIYLGFRGGKGVATGFGAMLGVFPHLAGPALGTMAVWALTLWLTHYISLASMIAAATLPLWFILMTFVRLWMTGPQTPHDGLWTRLSAGWPFLIVTVGLAMLVIWQHRTNIARLRAGTEPRIGEPAKGTPTL